MAGQKQITGRHVLFMMLGFFAAIVVVNGIFTYFAVASFSGLETEQAYLKGLDYNRTLTAAAQQRERGWQVDLQEGSEATAEGEGRPHRFDLRYLKPDGSPLEGLAVELELRRPGIEKGDRRVILADLGGGRYGGLVELPAQGQWKLRAEARQAGQVMHVLEQRLWLR